MYVLTILLPTHAHNLPT